MTVSDWLKPKVVQKVRELLATAAMNGKKADRHSRVRDPKSK